MKRSLIALTLFASLVLTGCPSAQVASRDSLLDQLQENLETIEPRMDGWLASDPRPEAVKVQDKKLVQDSIQSIKDARAKRGTEEKPQ